MCALRDLDLLDTLPSESFDRITRMASMLFDMPVSAVSLTDHDRQWFKSSVGTAGREIPRIQAPCAEVTRSGSFLLVPDLLQDSRFATSPLAQAGIRFYAGAPLITREGCGLGAMCVLDTSPRRLSPDQIRSLEDFAAMVMAQIELQRDFGRIDPLSGLPNRHQMVDDLEDAARQEPAGERTAILIDLIDGRQFNQTVSVLGTAYIDELVRTSGRIVREVLGDRPALYHVGMATYLAVLNGMGWRETVDALAARLGAPIWCGGIPISVVSAFGISQFRLGESVPRDVLRTSISAAQDAREADLDRAVYSSISDDAHRRQFTLLTDMADALRAPDQLRLVFQPRVDVRTGACVSAEALLRWQHPLLGNVPPGEFIPLLEPTALGRPITAWVIGTALDQVMAWRESGRSLRVSINVSAKDLAEPDFAERLRDELQRRSLPPNLVELELTESALIGNGPRVLKQLAELRDMGVEIAIDDFGTGYSTFAYLQRLPASIVKLDQSFIRDLTGNERDQILVRSMIGLAHDLGYRVVAEGVENAATRDLLVTAGCDELQGYLLSRPVPAVELDRWFQRGGSRNEAAGALLRAG